MKIITNQSYAKVAKKYGRDYANGRLVYFTQNELNRFDKKYRESVKGNKKITLQNKLLLNPKKRYFLIHNTYYEAPYLNHRGKVTLIVIGAIAIVVGVALLAHFGYKHHFVKNNNQLTYQTAEKITINTNNITGSNNFTYSFTK